MRRHDIKPLPKTENERAELQNVYSRRQFSRREDIDNNEVQPQTYFANEKLKFLRDAEYLGLDIESVQKFIEKHGLYERNMQIILDHLNDPKYFNPVKRVLRMPK